MKYTNSLGLLLASYVLLIYMFVRYEIAGEIHLISLLFAIAVSLAFAVTSLYVRIGEKK